MAYLKDPPEGYLYPAVDIVDALDQISAKLKKNDYSGEYDFQLDVRNVMNSAYDGHFNYDAEIDRTFVFYRELTLSSVSIDGLALPEIYLGNDTLLLQNDSGVATVSPVANINGREVQAWLNEYAAWNPAQDPDANYNTIFSSETFLATYNYQGGSTNVTFHNGTSRTLQHWAQTTFNFTGITDGHSFFQTFCTDEGKAKAMESQPDVPTSTAAPATEVPFKPVATQTAGFPNPVVSSSDRAIAGFLPNHDKDLAVLKIPTFQPVDDVEFSDVVRVFLATAQAAGK